MTPRHIALEMRPNILRFNVYVWHLVFFVSIRLLLIFFIVVSRRFRPATFSIFIYISHI